MGYTTVCHATDPQWLEERLKGVTATEAAHLLSGGSALELWARKTERAPPNDLSGNDRVWWGKWLEDKILTAYADKRYAGREVTPSGYLLRSDEYPWLLATLDAWTAHPEWGTIPLDAKNAGSDQAVKWEEGTPARYYWQLQQQTAVTGTQGASIACCVGGNGLVWTDEARADQDTLLKVTEQYWWCVTNDVPPTEMDGSRETRRALDIIYPDVNTDSRIDLGAWSIDADRELEHLTALIKARQGEVKQLADERAALENRIRREMGEAEIAWLPNGVHYVRRKIERSGYTVQPTSYTTLKRKEPKA